MPTVTLVALLMLAAPAGSVPSQAEDRARVVVATWADTIHPIGAEYLAGAITEAEELRADVFLLRLDTPGGLDLSMREIIQSMRNTQVPVVLFVAPSGARAASAGFFMAMAADVVVMAPGTNMGAASPVSVGGGEIDETMERKLMEDAGAYIRSLAEDSGRPVDLAAAAVEQGRSWSAREAVEAGLADFVAADVDAVLEVLEGRGVRKAGTERALRLEDAEVITREPSLRQRVLSVLANPQIAYMLMLAGIAGLYFELSAPGAILPGVLGGISLVLALLAFQVLPISWAGLALIILAVVFFIAEIKVTSYGLLTAAGLVAFVLGSLMLIPGPIPELRLQLSFVLPTAVAVAAVAAFLVWLVIGAHRGRVQTGTGGLAGERGRVTADIDPGSPGRVFVHGELWRAHSDIPLRTGDTVEVVSVESGMVLRVRRPTED